MSLKLAAQHLSSHGRGPDDTLVHMSRDEVKSLNDLAMAHGGQLTINPHTGLPEAGFLSNLLPTIAGFALDAAVPGLGEMTGLGSFAAPAIVGGASMLMGGGLKSGLLAGLGAYGGSQLAESLATSGLTTNAADISAQNTAAIDQAQKQMIAERQALIDSGQVTGQYTPEQIAQNRVNMMNEAQASMPSAANASRMSNIGAGLSSAANNPMAFLKANKYALAAAAAPGIMGALPSGQSGAGTDKVAAMNTPVPQRYQYTPGVQIQAPDTPSYNQMNRNFGSEVMNFQAPNMYTPIGADEARSIYGFASGGMAAGKNPIEQMSNQNSIGANTGFPQAYLHNNAYATPYQTPISQNVLTGPGDVRVDPYTGEQQMASGGSTGYASESYPTYSGYNEPGGNNTSNSPGVSNGSPTGTAIGDILYAIADQQISPMAAMVAQAVTDATSSTSPTSVNATNGMDVASDAANAAGASSAPSATDDGGGEGGGDGEARGGLSPYFKRHMATGGISDAHYNLGGYSDGGRLLRGPGDGVSDSIPATIGHRQPARLADGEFVVPARIVSELGNGSTEAGARKLYAMMDRVQAARKKTIGKDRVAHNSRADRYLPA
jgi:hypothetical protein